MDDDGHGIPVELWLKLPGVAGSVLFRAERPSVFCSGGSSEFGVKPTAGVLVLYRSADGSTNPGDAIGCSPV